MLHQVASTSLLKIMSEVNDKTPANRLSASAVIVRHPLARLASAYRSLVSFFSFPTWQLPNNHSLTAIISKEVYTFGYLHL